MKAFDPRKAFNRIFPLTEKTYNTRNEDSFWINRLIPLDHAGLRM